MGLVDAKHALVHGVIGKEPAERIKSSYIQLRECFSEKGPEADKELEELLQMAETRYKEFIERVEKSIKVYFPYDPDEDPSGMDRGSKIKEAVRKTEEHLISLLREGKIEPEDLYLIQDHCGSITELFDNWLKKVGEPEAKIIYVHNGALEKACEYSLKEDITSIGRDGDIELLLDTVIYMGEGHDEIGVEKGIRTSREHARILREGNSFIIEDIGSKTGTYINGEKLGKPHNEPWKVRFCHSDDYYSIREPEIRQNNKGREVLNDGDIITLGQEMYGDRHKLIFKLS